MESGLFWFVLLGFIAIVGVATYFSKEARFKRKLKKTPFKPIKEVRNGEWVKIRGIVGEAPEYLEGPLSGRKCVYYQVKVVEKNGKSSSTIINDEDLINFYVKFENEFALVQAEKHKVHLIIDRKSSSGTFDDATEKEKSFLAKYDKESEGLFGFNRNLKYSEGIIEPDELIAVMGKAQWKSVNQETGQGKISKILVLESDTNHPVYITDDPDLTKTA